MRRTSLFISRYFNGLVVMILLLAVAVGSARAQADEPTANPKALLQRIAAAYQAALDYRVEAETVVAGSDGEPPTRVRVRLAGSRPRRWLLEKQVLAPSRYDLRLGTDGEVIWGWLPRLKHYLQEQVTGNQEELVVLRDHNTRYFERFTELDRLHVRVDVRPARCRGERTSYNDCLLVQLDPGPEEGWLEDLWVDPVRLLVRRSKHRARKGLITVVTTTDWKKVELNAHPTDQTYRFSAPASSTRVHSLQLM